MSSSIRVKGHSGSVAGRLLAESGLIICIPSASHARRVTLPPILTRRVRPGSNQVGPGPSGKRIYLILIFQYFEKLGSASANACRQFSNNFSSISIVVMHTGTAVDRWQVLHGGMHIITIIVHGTFATCGAAYTLVTVQRSVLDSISRTNGELPCLCPFVFLIQTFLPARISWPVFQTKGVDRVMLA